MFYCYYLYIEHYIEYLDNPILSFSGNMLSNYTSLITLQCYSFRWSQRRGPSSSCCSTCRWSRPTCRWSRPTSCRTGCCICWSRSCCTWCRRSCCTYRCTSCCTCRCASCWRSCGSNTWCCTSACWCSSTTSRRSARCRRGSPSANRARCWGATCCSSWPCARWRTCTTTRWPPRGR